jgi:hypothetical protein
LVVPKVDNDGIMDDDTATEPIMGLVLWRDGTSTGDFDDADDEDEDEDGARGADTHCRARVVIYLIPASLLNYRSTLSHPSPTLWHCLREI